MFFVTFSKLSAIWLPGLMAMKVRTAMAYWPSPRTRRSHYWSKKYFWSLWVHSQLIKCCWIFRFLWGGFVNFLLLYCQSFDVPFDTFKPFFLTETTILWCEETTLFWLYNKCVNNDFTISRTINHRRKWYHFRCFME